MSPCTRNVELLNAYARQSYNDPRIMIRHFCVAEQNIYFYFLLLFYTSSRNRQILFLPKQVLLKPQQILFFPKQVLLKPQQILFFPKQVLLKPQQILFLPKQVILEP